MILALQHALQHPDREVRHVAEEALAKLQSVTCGDFFSCPELLPFNFCGHSIVDARDG